MELGVNPTVEEGPTIALSWVPGQNQTSITSRAGKPIDLLGCTSCPVGLVRVLTVSSLLVKNEMVLALDLALNSRSAVDVHVASVLNGPPSIQTRASIPWFGFLKLAPSLPSTVNAER